MVGFGRDDTSAFGSKQLRRHPHQHSDSLFGMNVEDFKPFVEVQHELTGVNRRITP